MPLSLRALARKVRAFRGYGPVMIIDEIAARAGRRAVLLDIDGTLVDSNGAHAQSWSLASAEFGFERPTEFFRPLIGMGGDFVLPKIAAGLDDESAPGSEIARRRGEIFKERFLPHVRPTRGARALIERLKASGWSCVIATSAKPDELQALLEIAGITEAIDRRSDASDAEASKPAPDIVVAALSKAGLGAESTFLLGDSPYDVEAATKAGVRVVAVRCGGFSDDDLAGASAIYDDPQAVLEGLGA